MYKRIVGLNPVNQFYTIFFLFFAYHKIQGIRLLVLNLSLRECQTAKSTQLK